jgi:hypothetical protein
MQFRFLGVGGAFDYQYGNASGLLELGGKHILVDCGHAVYPALQQHRLADNLDAVLITHLHDDHVGSLSTLIYYHYHILQRGDLKILTGSAELLNELKTYLSYPMQDPEKYARFGLFEEMDGIGAIETTGKHVAGMRTFGYIFFEPGAANPIVYSGDIGHGHYIFEQLEAIGMTGATVFHDITFFPGVAAHAYYRDVAEHLPDFQIFGYHHNPTHNPPDNPVPLVWNTPEFRMPS